MSQSEKTCVGIVLQTRRGPVRKLAAIRRRENDLIKDWMKALDSAHTVDAVLEVVGEFVATRSDVYWSGVPAELRNPELGSEERLQQWHHALVQAISRMVSPGTPMQELAVFSLRSAVRIHQINLRADPRASSNDREFSTAPYRRRSP
jgi:hypothetical protein